MTATDDTEIPENRWELGKARGDYHGYGTKFAELLDAGEDVDGEARFVDALSERNARILDAGSGMGRVGAALVARGHRVIGVEKDRDLIAQSRQRFPSLAVVESDLLALTPASFGPTGDFEPFDVVVMVGNVILFLAPDTEVRALSSLASLLAPQGRIVLGHHTHGGVGDRPPYSAEQSIANATAAGLTVEHHFAGYQLGNPVPDADYALLVLRRTA
ncbi:MAG: methyltransferase domain-containing protein [Microthrixaceae bacterium]